MQLPDAVTLVQAWLNAVNQQAGDQLVALSDANIEIIGPRGSAYGQAILRDWLGRAGLVLETQRLFTRHDVVVVAQHGVWRSVETGDVIGEADVASVFRVKDGHVMQYARYDTLQEAFAKSGLTEADEVKQQ